MDANWRSAVRDLHVLSLSFFFVFLAYGAIQNLESNLLKVKEKKESLSSLPRISRWEWSERRRWKRRQKEDFGCIRKNSELCVCTYTFYCNSGGTLFFFSLCCCSLYADWWSGMNLTRCAVSFSNNFITRSTFHGHAVGLQECHFVRSFRILDFHCCQSLRILLSYYQFEHFSSSCILTTTTEQGFLRKKEKKNWVYCDIFSHRNLASWRRTI